MGHNLNFNEATGKHSFFSVNEKAWHGLGQIVTDYPTSAEALEHAGLNYEVEKRRLLTPSTIPDDTESALSPFIDVPDHYATVRTDSQQVLGVVGKDYQVVQNQDAFSFFDAIVGGDGIQYETAGALGKGEKVFITAKLPNYIKVGKADLIEQYLFLTTSHDGYGSITAAFTPIRIVCNNTLNAALRSSSNTVKIRHTANAKERLEQAHLIMGISDKLGCELEEIFNNWSTTKITDAKLKDLIQLAMVPNKEVFDKIQSGNEDETSTAFKNICNSAFEYAMTSPSQQFDTTKGTLFGAYNAITGYFQNVKYYKNGEAKLKSVLYGGTAQTKAQKAFQLCKEYQAR